MARLQPEAIPSEALIEPAFCDGDGAVAVFVGTVRDHNQGRRVLYLEYSAYPEMAEAEMARIEDEAVRRFGVSKVVTVHRTGRVEIGEVSVAVVVTSPHRAAAFDACRFVIDTLKKTVPIWKKEFFEGGEIWIEDTPSDAPSEA